MSKLTKKQRDAMAVDDFVDSDGRRFPVKDASDVAATAKLFGRATAGSSTTVSAWKARLETMAKRKGLASALPAAWGEARHGADPEERVLSGLSIVAFAAGDDKREEGDYVVYPQRKLFEDGSYPSHAFEMDPDELALVAETSAQAALDLEHKPTVIRDDMIGHATNFTTDWQGDKLWLRGDVYVHKLLDPLLKPESKLSTTWDRESRSLQKVALLLNPKIPDAALQATYAAFADVAFRDRHDTRSGQRTMQRIHDVAAEGGAVCKEANVKDPPRFAAKHESAALQTIHDHAVEHGASCEGASGTSSGYYFSDSGEESGREAGMGATAGETAGKPQGSSQPSAEFADVRAEMDRMKADLEAERKKTAHLAAQNRRQAAVTFTDRYIREERVKPGVRDTVVALAERLLEDDETAATEIQFAGDQKGGRLDALAQLLDATPKANLTTERIAAFGDPNGQLLGEGDVDNDGMKSARQRIADRAKRYAGVKVVPAATGNGAHGNGAGGK